MKRQLALVMVANTLPVRRVKRRGKVVWDQSPGGLVSALAPITREAGGGWVGWTGERGGDTPPFELGGILNIPVPISSEDVAMFYEGVCNRTLWPLYHDAVRQPEYHRHWWRRYVEVNERFAERAAGIAAPGATVWVHDYHLQLVPAMLRDRRPDLRIGFFLHIPFPPEELFVRLPWRRSIVEGILGADVVGLQTKLGARNFTRLAQRYSDGRGRDGHVHVAGRAVTVERYKDAAADPATERRAAQLRSRLGGGRKVLLGVDRLDYTKGIDLRLKAFDQLLAGDAGPHSAVLVQVAVPSRERIEEYKELRRHVEELVGQINGEYGEIGVAAVHYLRRNLPFEELVSMYRAADVMIVTPFADGMNLVAKEYVASRVENTGVLILSEFAGAAAELKKALLVNPHDVDGMTEGMARALDMPLAEQSQRMRAMRLVLDRHTVHDWAADFMQALEK